MALTASTVQRKVKEGKANNIIALHCKLEGLKAEKFDALQARCRAEIQAAHAKRKAKDYTEKFHILEKKSVERDLRSAWNKLCESTFLQESVAASAFAPSVDP